MLGRLKYCLILGLMALGGCTTTVKEKHPGVVFLCGKPLALNAQKIQVKIAPSTMDASIRHPQEVSLSPAFAVMACQCLKDRFIAKGGAETCVITIEKASFREEDFSKEKVGLFETLPLVYKGTLSVRFECFTKEGRLRAGVLLSVSRTQNTSQSLTLYERQEKLVEIGEAMLNALDAKLLETLRSDDRLKGLI